MLNLPHVIALYPMKIQITKPSVHAQGTFENIDVVSQSY